MGGNYPFLVVGIKSVMDIPMILAQKMWPRYWEEMQKFLYTLSTMMRFLGKGKLFIF